MRTRNLAQVVATAAVTVAALAAPAGAATGPVANDLQKKVDQQIVRYGGTQTAPNEVSYNGGSVKVVIPGGSRSAAAACPSGWYCFYANGNFEGRRLQFRDCGGTQSLEDYGFKNQASSWDNNSNNTVHVYDRDVNPFKLLWTMRPKSMSSTVPAGTDNKADFFNTICDK